MFKFLLSYRKVFIAGWILCVLFVSVFISPVKAQVATYYTFSQSDQTYKSDTSTTSVVPANIFTTGWDDNTYTTYKFPFNFTYNGVLYTGGTSTIGLDTDGWMAFSTTGSITMTGTTAGGSWISASNSTGVYLNGTANNNGICGFNSDLEEQAFPTFTGNTTNGSAIVTNVSDFANIRVGTRLSGTGITNGTVVNSINLLTSSIRLSGNATATGTGVVLTPRTSVYAFIRGVAPYRQFVIQWTRATRFNGPVGDDFSFQIVLNEGGGLPAYQTLQAVYGVCKATNTTPQNAQVGLRGASAADYNARTTASNWSATTAATANTDVCTLTPAVFPSSGLTFTWSPACPASAGPAGAISGPLNVCPGTSVDYSIPGVPGAIFYTWTYTGTNTTLSGTTTLPVNTLIFDVTATGGTLTVTPGNLCGTGSSSSIAISMSALPSASISYPAASYCTSASPVSVTQTGTPGGTYTASPSGLSINATTGQVTPSSSTPGTYTVTYSYVSGCAGTATASLTINPGPVLTASASPASICTGSNSNLQANIASNANYTVSSIAYSSLAPSGSPTVLFNSYVDDGVSAAVPMPFAFNFYGSAITQFYVSTNGHIQLQTTPSSGITQQTIPDVTTPNNVIALAWDDLVIDPFTQPGAYIRYFTNGTAPNQVLVIEYNKLRFLGGTSAENVTGQIRIYQNDNHIEVAVATVNDDGGSYAKTLGIENAAGTVGITPPGRNNIAWNVSVPEAWAFYPPLVAATYVWSPATFLSSTTIANPVATAVTATTTYTVTATNTATGCSAAANVTVTVSSIGAAGAITGPSPVCPNTTQTYSLTAVAGATSYNWAYSGTGATFSANTAAPSNSVTFASGATAGTLTVTPVNSCGTGTSSGLAIAITTITSATISYPAASYCISTVGSIAVTRTGPAGGTFTASPAGLTIVAGTGAITPSSSTAGTYTVTYAYTSSGCAVTATTTVAIVANPTVTASASPATVCSGNNSQLTATVSSTSNYTVNSIAFSSLSPSGSPTTVWNTYVDDALSAAIPMPFSFTFYGNTITQFYVSTNGHIQLETSAGSANAEQLVPNAATPNNVIALAWDDLVVDPTTNTGSSVRYFVNGTTPNRVLVIDYVNLRFIADFSGAAIVTGQIRLYESDKHIEVAAGTVNDNGASRTKTLGIENSTGTLGVSPAGRNLAVWNVSNEAWGFYPPVVSGFTYAWSPATFLSNTAISNPMANGVTATTAYTVTATNTTTGCSGTANVTVTLGAVLSGTYTVGVAGNYPTLTAAVNAYNTLCIGGPIIFSLLDNTYIGSETFPITINKNSSASAVNTLTIRPAATIAPNISGSVANNAVIRILGDYVTIDGSNNGTTSRNLAISNTSTTSPSVILFGSTGTTPVINSTLKNCVITNGATTSSAVLVSNAATIGTAGYFNNITIENNRLRKAFMGIYCIGVNTATNGQGLNILSNDLAVSNASNALYDVGIYLQDITGATIQGNQIGNFTGTNSYDDKGIWLATGVRNTSVLNNTISNLNYTGGLGYGGQGIYISSATANAGIRLAHNMIANMTGDGYDYTSASYGIDNPAGIVLTGTQSGIEIFFNSINLYGNTLNSANAISAGIRLLAGSVADIRNNIIVNNLGRSGALGYGAIGILAATSNTQFTNLNYNDYFINPSSGNKYFGQIATTGQTTLAGWRTASGREAQGINVSPTFTAPTDLHLYSATNANSALNNLGTPIAGITTDYDNNTRNGLTPDMGADEFVPTNYGSWVGKTSTDWLVATNWEDNVVPDGTRDVFITGGYTFMPTIVTTQAVRDLNLSTGVPGNPPLLTLNAGTLQVNRNITRTGGSINGSNGTLEMNGTAAQTIPALLFQNNNLKNLVIGNTNSTGVTIGGALDIYRSLTFSAGGTKLNTGNFLTFKSTATETAWLGNVTGKTITGTATVERYIPTGTGGLPNHGKSWQLLAVPVKGTQTVNQAWQDTATSANQSRYAGYGTQLTSNISGAVGLGFDVYTPTGGPSVKTYDPATNTYIGIANTTSLPIQQKKGYLVFVRGDRTVTAYNQAAVPTVLRTKGTLFTTGADIPPVTTVLAGKFESIGNPYASAIDFLSVSRPAPALLDDAYYVWDPLLYGSYGLGDYQLISAGNGWKPNPGGTANYNASVAYTKIQSGQAFFVHATGAGGNVSFTEAAKISGSQLTYRPTPQLAGSIADRQFLRASLYAVNTAGTYIASGNVAAFDPEFTNGYDYNDNLKMTSSTENFSISLDDKLLGLEAREPVKETDTIFYSLKNLRRMPYQLRFAPENMGGFNLMPYLVDTYLRSNTILSVIDTTVVDFTVTDDAASAAENRFMVVFRLMQPVPVNFTHIAANRNSDKSISVDWKVENETDMNRYELERSSNGRAFSKLHTAAAKSNNGGETVYDYLDGSPLSADNFYRVKAVGRNGQEQFSSIVKVGPLKTAPSISVYPNPVVDNTIRLLFSNQPAGEYTIQLTNQLGQVFYKGRWQVTGSNGVRSFDPGIKLAAGIYQLLIVADNGVSKVLRVEVK